MLHYRETCLSDICAREPEARAQFHRITNMATEMFDVPLALISLVEEPRARLYFLGHTGLGHPWAARNEAPMGFSYCHLVTSQNAPLALSDARAEPVINIVSPSEDLGIAAYLGVPLHGTDGTAVGAICLIQDVPRRWSDVDIQELQTLADLTCDLISLQSYLHLGRNPAHGARISGFAAI